MTKPSLRLLKRTSLAHIQLQVKGKGKAVRMHARKARGMYSVGTATHTINVGTTVM